jgi:hypothetical protein
VTRDLRSYIRGCRFPKLMSYSHFKCHLDVINDKKVGNRDWSLGTAAAMVNMGGFLASLLVMQAMGLIIGAAGGYSFESFRLAWTVQYVVWVLAAVGILITRKKARRLMKLEQERYGLEGFDSHPGKPAASLR